MCLFQLGLGSGETAVLCSWVELEKEWAGQKELTGDLHFGHGKFELTVTHLPSVNTFFRKSRVQHG